MQTTMDQLVDEFNQTVGKEQGIFLSITSISDSATIREKLTMIADDDPGAPAMPDIATCYPQTAAILAAKGLLAPLDAYFEQGELDLYVPRFWMREDLATSYSSFPSPSPRKCCLSIRPFSMNFLPPPGLAWRT